MSDKPAVFGLPAVWNDAFKDFADVYTAIDNVQQVAADLVKATQDNNSDVVEVLRILTSANSVSMTDVIILTGNRRGVGAMKVARSIFEFSITAEYLAQNPGETDLYLDFAHVTSLRYLQAYERMNPGKVSAEHKTEAEAQFNRVKGKFEKNGKVRNSWSGKNLKEMAEAIGPDRANLYELVPGKGLARYLKHGSVRFQPLPIGTAREVFPQAARPVHFVERVMGPVARGRLSQIPWLPVGAGYSSPSTVPGPHRDIRYSISANRC